MNQARELALSQKSKMKLNEQNASYARLQNIAFWISDNTQVVYASCKDPMDLQARALCQQINEEPHSYMDAIYVLKDAGYID